MAAGASRMGLARRVAAGELRRVARGLYALPGHPGGEHQALALVARRAPDTIFCLSESSRRPGVEIHRVQKTPIHVTGIAKTIADCFKFRNKIGLDVALEALRDARRANRVAADDLWRAAKIDRVANVMRPYLEALP